MRITKFILRIPTVRNILKSFIWLFERLFDRHKSLDLILCLFYEVAKFVIFWNLSFKDMGSSKRDNDSSPNLSVNDLKQKEIEIKEGSARVLWYETELLIGRPNGGSPKLSKYQRG